jgi:hypothetical protein
MLTLESVRYLVNSPIDGLTIQNGQHAGVHLPGGAVFTLAPKIALNSRLIEATWDEKSILLFADDLTRRCEKIASGPIAFDCYTSPDRLTSATGERIMKPEQDR